MSTPVVTLERTALGSEAAPRRCAVHSPVFNVFDADGTGPNSLDAGCQVALGAKRRSRLVHTNGGQTLKCAQKARRRLP
jgi:hypothetical protein